MERLVTINECDTIYAGRPSIPVTCCVTETRINAGELCVRLQDYATPAYANVSLAGVDVLVQLLDAFQPNKDSAKRQLRDAEAVECYDYSYVDYKYSQLDAENMQCMVCGSKIVRGSFVVFAPPLVKELGFDDSVVACHADCTSLLSESLASLWEHTSELMADSL